MTATILNDCVFPLGALCRSDGIHFATPLYPQRECGIYLVPKKQRLENGIKIPLNYHMGDIYYGRLTGVDPADYFYCFYQDDTLVSDVNMRKLAGKRVYGTQMEEVTLAAFYENCFDWEEDYCPKISWGNCIHYLLHVRGFTKHSSSKVKNKGTFAGLLEKIPYLKELGITTLELMPAYEFEEKEFVVETGACEPSEYRLNFWGYKEGLYYVPKSGYSAAEDSCEEMKRLVKELHKNHMELILQFFFPKEYRIDQIRDILVWWRQEYHVDGFHVKGPDIWIEQIAADPVMSDTKLIYERYDVHQIYEEKKQIGYKNLALMDENSISCLRRFLKGDDNMIGEVQKLYYESSPYYGVIHSLTNYNTFTLWDMLSYDRKHNESNGEFNRDGTDENYSWNCGEEGASRKKAVLTLRRKQFKNATALLFTLPGTPMLCAGDEFARTCCGNNNPYCQDNEINWVNWKLLDKNKDLFLFVKQMIELRKKHNILHLESGLKMLDSLSCGCPDLSFHSEEAWRNPRLAYEHHFGVMLCGDYAEDDYFYVAYNMHWQKHVFALPNLPKGLEWKLELETGNDKDLIADDARKAVLESRCIRVYRSFPRKGF